MHALLHSVPPTQQQVTASTRLHQRTLGTHGQVWGSLLCGHCSFPLGSGAHKFLFVPSKSLFPPSCVSSGGSMVGLMVTSSKRAYIIPRYTAPRAHAPAAAHCWPIPPQEILKHSSGSVSGFWCTQGMFESSKYLWQVWGLILNRISPFLPYFWDFSFAPGHGVSPQSCSSTTQPPLQYDQLMWGGFSISLFPKTMLLNWQDKRVMIKNLRNQEGAAKAANTQNLLQLPWNISDKWTLCI